MKKEQATDFVLKTKEQVESGEITFDVLDQAKNCARQATSIKEAATISGQWQEQSTTPDVAEDQEEIIINITAKYRYHHLWFLEMVILSTSLSLV